MMLHLLFFHSGADTTLLTVEALVLLVLIVLSAFFSGSEVALISLSKLRRRQLVEEDAPGAQAVDELMEEPNAFLVTILIGNNLVNVAAASLATAVAIGIVGPEALGLATGVATGVMTLLILTFGEITPKAYATQHNEEWSLRAAPMILLLQRVLLPVVVVFTRFTDRVFRAFGASEAVAETAFRSEEELKTLIQLGTEEGILEEEEQEMIHSVIELGDIVVREVMVPRPDVVALPVETSLEEARRTSVASGYSRIPIIEGSLDEVVGILYVKDLLHALVEGKGEEATVRAVMKDPYLVPETKRLDDFLRDMQARRVHLAIVVDEFGGTAGIVTMEDVLEEIVGDIFDEYDLRRDPIQRVDERTAVVDARVDVEDLNEALGIHLPEDDHYETVAGFIVHELGRLGREGEVVRVDGVDLVVEKVSHRRILRVRVVRRREGRGEG